MCGQKYKNPFLSNRLHVKNERSECCLNILVAHTCRIKRVRKASFSQEQEHSIKDHFWLITKLLYVLGNINLMIRQKFRRDKKGTSEERKIPDRILTHHCKHRHLLLRRVFPILFFFNACFVIRWKC